MIGDDWEALVRPAVAGALPDLRDAPLRRLGAGLENVALLLDEVWVLRFPQNEEAAESVLRESRLLPELDPTLPIEIPRFSFMAPNPLGLGVFCGYRLVPGESLSPREWRVRGLTRGPGVVRQIAEVLDALHAFPVERARDLKVPEWDLRGDFTDGLDQLRAEVVPLLTDREAATLLDAWARYLAEDRNFAYSPTFTHADVCVEHLLVGGDEISGLIDFGDAEIGDPDYDLSYLWAQAGPEFVRRVQEQRGRALTETQAAKLGFWALADPANALLHAIETDLPSLREAMLTTLRARLADETKE